MSRGYALARPSTSKSRRATPTALAVSPFRRRPSETTVPITLSQGGADLNFTSGERTLSLTKLESKLQAAVAAVASRNRPPGLFMAYQKRSTP